MSKQLNSILNKLPHATASKNVPISAAEKEKPNLSIERKLIVPNSEKMTRIVAPVPFSLKQDLKRYIVDHPDETEKSLILKGLRTLGFTVPDEYIEDKRKNK